MLKSVPWRRNNCDINTKPAASWLCLLKKQKQILSNVIFTSGRVKKKKKTQLTANNVKYPYGVLSS